MGKPRSGNSSYSFGPERRLKLRNNIQAVQNRGKKVHCKHFLIMLSAGEKPESRLAVTVTTKLDKRAVVRNRIKRRVREIFRQHRHKLKGNFDIVVIARRGAEDCTQAEMRDEIVTGLTKAKFLT